MSRAEKKLFIVLCYYLLVDVAYLISTAYGLVHWSTLETAVQQYFSCEAPGHIPRKCDRGSFEQQIDTSVWLYSIYYLLLGFVPVVNFMFVFNLGEVRKKLTICCTKIGEERSNDT